MNYIGIYCFNTKDIAVYIKAIPNAVSYPNELVTYYLNGLELDKATIVPTGNINLNFSTKSRLTTTINNHQQESVMYISPNPTSSEFVINTSTIADNIIVSNAIGRVIAEVRPSSLQTTINLAEFEFGVYFVQVLSGQKSSVTKVVKY